MITETVVVAPSAAGGEEANKRKQILDGASRVFLECGYEGASMSSIAHAAGVSKGTLYVYFTNKEGLFAAVVEQHCQETAGHVFDGLDDSGPLEAILFNVGHTFINRLLRPKMEAIYRTVISESPKFPELGRAFYDTGPRYGIGRMAAFLRRRVEQGELEIDDTELAATQFLDLCKSTIIMKRQMRVLDMPGPAQIDHVIRQAVTLFLKGYRRHG